MELGGHVDPDLWRNLVHLCPRQRRRWSYAVANGYCHKQLWFNSRNVHSHRGSHQHTCILLRHNHRKFDRRGRMGRGLPVLRRWDSLRSWRHLRHLAFRPRRNEVGRADNVYRDHAAGDVYRWRLRNGCRAQQRQLRLRHHQWGNVLQHKQRREFRRRIRISLRFRTSQQRDGDILFGPQDRLRPGESAQSHCGPSNQRGLLFDGRRPNVDADLDGKHSGSREFAGFRLRLL